MILKYDQLNYFLSFKNTKKNVKLFMYLLITHIFVFFILYLTILCIFHKPFLVIIKIKYGKLNLASMHLYKAPLKTELRSISILCCV